MGQERVEIQHIGTAHSHTTVKKMMKTALIMATSFAPTSKKNFGFGPLRRGKFIFRLIKNPPYIE
jgi:hypothetical protein